MRDRFDTGLTVTSSEITISPQAKLSKFLSTNEIDLNKITDDDKIVFEKASKRIRYDSLTEVVEEMKKRDIDDNTSISTEDNVSQISGDCGSTEMKRSFVRAQSTGNVYHTSYHLAIKRTQSNDCMDKLSYYLVLAGKYKRNPDTTAAISYNLKTRRIVKSDMKVSKRKTVTGLVSGNIGGAPYIYMMSQSNKRQMKLKKYDVIESKWMSCSKPQRKLADSFMVAVQNDIYCFPKDNRNILQYDFVNNRWARAGQLDSIVISPMFCEHDGKIYIFENNQVQCFEPFTGHVSVNEISASYVSVGFAISFHEAIYILSDANITRYDPGTKRSERFEFPYLSVQPLHAVYVVQDEVYALMTNTTMGHFEIQHSVDLQNWKKQLSFPKEIDLASTVTLNYSSQCPFAPFEDDINSLRHSRFVTST